MSDRPAPAGFPSVLPAAHAHVFLGEGHERAERRTWWVIALCLVTMIAEIVAGLLFGSIALIAEGIHMSTHAGALTLAALAYRFARAHADDARFSFGTGKLGDLAGFTSAIALAMIALLIGYEALHRVVHPVPIRFDEAIPVACLGLVVNVASVWLLGGGAPHDHHGPSRGHDHGRGRHDHDDEHRIATAGGVLGLAVVERGHPPVFRLRALEGVLPPASAARVETVRPDGTREVFALEPRGDCLQGREAIPEPHAFTVHLVIDGRDHPVAFAEHDHAPSAAHRDNNMRAAVIHVLADAAVSVLVIAGLVLARVFGWPWMDPLAGIAGAGVIAAWSYGLARDTAAILLDMRPDPELPEAIRRIVEGEGDRLTDLHLWRLGPGHLGAILSVATRQEHDPRFYRERLARFASLSHVTVEVQQGGSP